MSSVSLQTWMTTGMQALDQIENVHAQVGGAGPGRRYATEQINRAYVMLLSSHFQEFCRKLHAECVEYLVGTIVIVPVRRVLQTIAGHNLRLDWGNPNAGNIGIDFNAFGITFWPDVKAYDRRKETRHKALETLNLWRNAFAHNDFSKKELGGRKNVRLKEVKKWRSACNGLARSFDEVMRRHLRLWLGQSPWVK